VPISLASFNLKNLQSPGRPMHRGGKPWTEAEYAKKIAWTAAMLRRIDADIIGFQEAWSVDALTDAFRTAGLDIGKTYHLVARDGALGRPQVALAARRTRFDVRASAWTETVPPNFLLRYGRVDDAQDVNALDVRITSLSRPPLAVRLRLRQGPYKGSEVALWVAHLKSKRPMDLDGRHYPTPRGQANPWNPYREAIGSALSTVRRAAEATALRMMLTDAMLAEPALPAAVLGDLNDGTLSVTTTVVSGEPPYRLWAKSTAGSSGARTAIGLYSAETLQQYRSQRDVYYTHVYANRLESLDHVLVSRHFYDHSPERLWSFRELKVWNDHLHDANPEGKTAEAWPGDHAVVAAFFDDNPAPKVAGSAVAAAGERDDPA
jgi:predicted extracellular nuclease